MSVDRLINRQMRQQWRFDHATATSANENGTQVQVTQGGRSAARTEIGSAGINASAGDRLLMLGAARGDMPMPIGKSSWIVG